MSEKHFFELTLVWSGFPFVLEPEYHRKKYKPLGQYFPLRKCGRKLRVYTKNLRVIFDHISVKENIDGRSQNFFYSLWATKGMGIQSRLKLAWKKVFLTRPKSHMPSQIWFIPPCTLSVILWQTQFILPIPAVRNAITNFDSSATFQQQPSQTDFAKDCLTITEIPAPNGHPGICPKVDQASI